MFPDPYADRALHPDTREKAMLRSIKSLQRSKIVATDGEIGHVDEFYFDDEQWVIRYLVVDTTSWRLGPQVLVSPMAIRQTNWDLGTLTLSITREQVKNSPPIDTQRPVSRQHEREYLRYYHYPYYWGDVGLWGSGPTPADLLGAGDAQVQRDIERQVERDVLTDDAHLRSTREVIGYHVQATDGELGHIADFLVDDRNWAIRYAVIDTSNWWFGKKVLIASEWIDDVNWSDSKVSIDLSRQAVKDAPSYDPHAPIDDQWETDYFTHYQRHGRWQTRSTASPGYVSLKEHNEFEVAPTDSDPRGWKVVTGSDGRIIGKVDDLIADPATMKVRYLDVDLDSSLQQSPQPERRSHILLPVGYARLIGGDQRVTVEGLSIEDIGHVPRYEALPVSPEYDETFRESVRHVPSEPIPTGGRYQGSVARRDHSGG